MVRKYGAYFSSLITASSRWISSVTFSGTPSGNKCGGYRTGRRWVTSRSSSVCGSWPFDTSSGYSYFNSLRQKLIRRLIFWLSRTAASYPANSSSISVVPLRCRSAFFCRRLPACSIVQCSRIQVRISATLRFSGTSIKA